MTSARQAHIFGVLLSDKFLWAITGESWTVRAVILLSVAVSATTTFLTMRQSAKRGMMNQQMPDPDQPGAAMAQSMSKNMMYIAPFFALTGLYWQYGLVIYWVTTNVWTLGQQHILFRNLPIVGSATAGSATSPAVVSDRATVSRAAGRRPPPRTTVPPKTATKAGTAAKPGTATKPEHDRRRTGTAVKASATATAINGHRGHRGEGPGRRRATAKSRVTTALLPNPPPTPPRIAVWSAPRKSGNGGRGLLGFGKGKQEPELAGGARD